MSEAEIVSTFLERIGQSDSVADNLSLTLRNDLEIITILLGSNRHLLDAVQSLRRENAKLRDDKGKTPAEARLLETEARRIKQAMA